MTRNCNATNSVLMAAVGSIENELEIIGRHYSLTVQPRALVSCRFPYVSLSSCVDKWSTGGDVTELLRAVPTAAKSQSEAWLPVLQALGNCVDVVNAGDGASLRSDCDTAAQLGSVCLDSLSWMGAFAAPGPAGCGEKSRESLDSSDSRDSMKSHLSSGGYLLLRVVRGPIPEQYGGDYDSVDPKRTPDTVIDMLQELRVGRKGAQRSHASHVESVPRRADGPAARSMQELDASAFVHDIRNVLKMISGNLELHQQRGSRQSDKALSAAHSGVAIARDYLRAMHGSRSQAASASSSELVAEVAQLVQGLLGSEIGLELFLDEPQELPGVDALGLKRSLLNLLLNAKQALPDGGQITLSTHNGPGYVEFRVADNGGGIHGDLTPTSKRLDLHSVQTFVTGARGSVGIENKDGKGTSVCITLPQQLGDTNE